MNYCGTTKDEVIPATGHEYTEERIEATCTEPGYTLFTCTRCGYSKEDNRVEPLGHRMSDWQEITPASCSAPGLEQKNCYFCEYVEEREIPQLEHSMGPWTISVEAGCEETSVEIRECELCDYREIRSGSALGHDLGEWKEEVPPTCGSSGLEKRHCSRCEYYEEREIPQLGHSMSQWTVKAEAGCEEASIEVRKCESCGYEEMRNGASLGHDMGQWQIVNYPSCDGAGQERRICSRCDYSETRELEAAGHEYRTTVTAATCIREGYSTHSCIRCGHSYVTSGEEALGHSYQAAVTPPDCEHGGYTIYTCTRCSYSYTDQETEARSHDWQESASTRSSTQNTEQSICYTCSNCSAAVTGKMYAAGSNPCESAHNLTQWTVKEEASCSDWGMLQRRCSNCDYEEFRQIPPKGHNFQSSVTAASCEEGGVTKYTCSICREEYADGYTPALGHDLTDWTLVEAALCEVSGLECRACTRCAYTQERDIPDTGHDYLSTIVEATCETDGYTVHSCTMCGNSFVNDHTKALGHAMGDVYTVLAADCMRTGLQRSDCTRCNYHEENVIPEGEHTYMMWVTEPTCIEAGYTTHICTACGDSYIGDHTEPIDHSYEDGVCIWCGAEETLVQWYSGSTSLNGTIDLNMYVILPDNLVNDPETFVRFTFENRQVDVPMADALVHPLKDGRVTYRFTCPLFAKQVADSVLVQVMRGETPVCEPKAYSAMQYCKNLINKNEDPEAVAMCKAMLNYAAAAQLLFNYNTENLANESLSEEDKNLPTVDVSAHKYTVINNEPGIRARGATMMMESEIRIRVYFALDAGRTIDEYTFTIDGVEVQPEQNDDGMWYIESAGIVAKEMEEMHEFKCGGITVTYGALSYVNSKLTDDDPLTVNLAKALYAYYIAAENLLG